LGETIKLPPDLCTLITSCVVKTVPAPIKHDLDESSLAVSAAILIEANASGEFNGISIARRPEFKSDFTHSFVSSGFILAQGHDYQSTQN